MGAGAESVSVQITICEWCGQQISEAGQHCPFDAAEQSDEKRLIADGGYAKPPEIMATDVSVVLLSCVLGNCFGGSLHDCTYTTLGEVDQRVPRSDVLSTNELLDVTLDAQGEISVTGLPRPVGGIFSLRDVKPVLSLNLFDVPGLDLWNLECSEADSPAELETEIGVLTGVIQGEGIVFRLES